MICHWSLHVYPWTHPYSGHNDACFIMIHIYSFIPALIGVAMKPVLTYFTFSFQTFGHRQTTGHGRFPCVHDGDV